MKVLLFDLFGVIAKPQGTAARDRLESVAGVPGPQFWEAYWRLRPPYDAGRIDGPGYWHGLGTSLGSGFADGVVAELIKADIASWSDVDSEMVDFVLELRRSGYRLGLLSNIPMEIATEYRRRSWLDVFHTVAFSCEIGHAKPEPDAYAWAVRVLGSTESEVLFIDDRSENIVAAEAMGIRGHLFVSISELRTMLDAG
jgi:putative hydrolase of the HAD superfamily